MSTLLAWEGMFLGTSDKIMSIPPPPAVVIPIFHHHTDIINNNVDDLLPTFRNKLYILFSRMRARGFDPILYEGLRTQARANELAAKGVGITNSIHIYGGAADIISEKNLWGAPKSFWDALGQETENLGMTWGGRFKRVDLPHVQIVTVAEQNNFRQLADATSREAFLDKKFENA